MPNPQFQHKDTKSLFILGGNLGLFTGMSILSMCEIVFWIVRILARLANKMTMNNRKPAVDSQRTK